MNQPIVSLLPREKWHHQDRFQLIEDYYDVPAGFITDGLSVPFGFRWLFPPLGRGFGAGVMHDFNLREGYGWVWANQEFESALYRTDIPVWKVECMVLAVKLWAKWKMRNG